MWIARDWRCLILHCFGLLVVLPDLDVPPVGVNVQALWRERRERFRRWVLHGGRGFFIESVLFWGVFIWFRRGVLHGGRSSRPPTSPKRVITV